MPSSTRCDPTGVGAQICAPDGSGWSATQECSGNFGCVSGSCSTSQCRAGYKRCGSDCIPTAMCCRADGCCGDQDCPRCQKCTSGRCVNQGPNEDTKNECPDGATCKTGRCDGNGGCGNTPNGQGGSGCNGGAACVNGNSALRRADECQNGSCRQGETTSCGANARCQSNRCVSLKELGDACSGGGECASGNCVDRVCCDSSSCEICHNCARGTGRCTSIQLTVSPPSSFNEDTTPPPGEAACTRARSKVCDDGGCVGCGDSTSQLCCAGFTCTESGLVCNRTNRICQAPMP